MVNVQLRNQGFAVIDAIATEATERDRGHRKLPAELSATEQAELRDLLRRLLALFE